MKRVQNKRDILKLMPRDKEETHIHKERQLERQSEKWGGETQRQREIEWEAGRQREKQREYTD